MNERRNECTDVRQAAVSVISHLTRVIFVATYKYAVILSNAAQYDLLVTLTNTAVLGYAC